jgi:hypothetical protein
VLPITAAAPGEGGGDGMVGYGDEVAFDTAPIDAKSAPKKIIGARVSVFCHYQAGYNSRECGTCHVREMQGTRPED